MDCLCQGQQALLRNVDPYTHIYHLVAIKTSAVAYWFFIFPHFSFFNKNVQNTHTIVDATYLA